MEWKLSQGSNWKINSTHSHPSSSGYLHLESSAKKHGHMSGTKHKCRFCPSARFSTTTIKIDHQARALFDKIFEHLNLKTFEDWYQIQSEDVRAIPTLGLEASAVLRRYQGSLIHGLERAYPGLRLMAPQKIQTR